ncbi:MAG TPA: TlpA disulfide reductase family protein [Ohtaekwangia sp.]|nr:TlpA disulfide reductase family protein [Ohtaekwangia sp.]
MIRLIPALILNLILLACTSPSEKDSTVLKEGLWRATLSIQHQELPFNFEIRKDSTGQYVIYLINAAERLKLDDISFSKDSVTIPLHIFDASIRAKIEGSNLTGTYTKHYEKDYRVPFHAEYGKPYRFKVSDDNVVTKNYTGTYSVTIFKEKGTTPAVGVFQQTADSVTGTFLTPTGDYRFLQGNIIGDSMFLSTFDGNNMYLFKAGFKNDSTLEGNFYSGKTSLRPWVAHRDDTASLPEQSITFLKDGYDEVSFTFPDVNGNNISLSDDKYKGKVVILQIFGTWCPNCMDETKFLAPWYKQNHRRGVEIIGLAFERKPDFNYASTRVKKMIDKLDVDYDFVIAGTNNKESTAEALPMLTNVSAYPTTIFIGKDGKVKKIHTGFSGPGTGVYYEHFKEEFNETINNLLKEETP